MLNTILQSEIGAKHQQLFNESKTFLLAIHEKEASEVHTKYVVIDVATHAILKKGTFRPGYLIWKDNHTLELLDVPGIIPKGKNLANYTHIIQLTQQNK